MFANLRRWTWVPVFVIAASILAGCVTINPGFRAAAPTTPTQFTADLVAALISRDDDQLRAMMSDPFVLAIWGGIGEEAAPDAVLDRIRNELIGEDTAITVVSPGTVQEWLGNADPLTLWPEDVQPVAAVGVAGLGPNGADQAVLVVVETGPGRYAWYALLLATDGFAAYPNLGSPDIIVVKPGLAVVALLPTNVEEVLIMNGIGIFSAPTMESNQVGVATVGQTQMILGISADGQWYAINCPSEPSKVCWISANPTFVRPTKVGPGSIPTVAPTAPTATATPSPVKTATRVPATPTPVYPIRIDFRPGQTTAVVSGYVGPYETAQYVVYAGAGQRMRLLLDSPSPAANFAVQGVYDGLQYKTFSDPSREWYFNVPRSQDYLVTITAPVNTSFVLEVMLAGGPAPTATPLPGPERISFGPGETSAVRSGQVVGGQARQYVFLAQAGQETRILLESNGGAANFALRGATDGVVYKTLNNPAREFSLILPRTQDYLITIASSVNTYYTLELYIAPLTPTAVPTSTPERITFAPGQTSAVRSGPLYANTPKSYVFYALAGQQTRVLLDSPSPVANFSVQGVSDGVVYKSFADPARDFSFRLPRSQDYRITIQAPVNTSYVLELIILPLPEPDSPTPTPTHIVKPPTPTPTKDHGTVPPWPKPPCPPGPHPTQPPHPPGPHPTQPPQPPGPHPTQPPCPPGPPPTEPPQPPGPPPIEPPQPPGPPPIEPPQPPGPPPIEPPQPPGPPPTEPPQPPGPPPTEPPQPPGPPPTEPPQPPGPQPTEPPQPPGPQPTEPPQPPGPQPTEPPQPEPPLPEPPLPEPPLP
jgi:hypothetical protein